ncbi:Rhomboid protein 2 [Ceratocystis fimbriata CBS 114723]|uniref:rhomboid protease n=1 Tax=Ceratocystis fimbriata CBS 114723 TaxID=1035309 RepID=A0A2C5XMB7_9PEZI|nr:Rhomboid protein 2 [Ceratocystis fimbriata CBS 114723]
MPPSVQRINTARARSFITRLPLFTRCASSILVLLWIVSLQSSFDIFDWGCLKPTELNFAQSYRLNTYPIVHLSVLHLLGNVFTLTPLMERFELEYGTLTTLAMFAGPLATLPAFLYIFIERVLLRGATPIAGASIWVFLLIAMEATKTARTNPHFMLGPYKIPTWTTPLGGLVVVAALVPSSSFLGHVCGVAVGYICGMGYIKYLAPPERILRWVESKLNLLAILPHYVSVDQKTYGRFGVLPTSGQPLATSSNPPAAFLAANGSGQRLGP